MAPGMNDKPFIWVEDAVLPTRELENSTSHVEMTERKNEKTKRKKKKKKKKKDIQWSKLYSFAGCGLSKHPISNIENKEDSGFSRFVYCNNPYMSPDYSSNYVSTTKYNVFTYLPKSLFEQFRRVANLYFLFAAACSLTPIAPFSPMSLITPFVFVVGVSMLKEAIEDWKRHIQDKEINNRKVKVHNGDGVFVDREWKVLRVGDVVKIEKDQYFPADLLLLASNFEDGICYVETMNLDGETNLKLKKSLEITSHLDEDIHYKSFTAIITSEDPNPNLYTFTGNLDYSNGSNTGTPQLYPLNPQQILLRDSKLQNTEYIYGVIIFTGYDTKVVQNSTKLPSKRSRIEMRMDKIIYFLFCLLVTICAIGSITFGLRTKNDLQNSWYLMPENTTSAYDPNKTIIAGLLHFVTALILYGYLIPISLYVSMEMVKVMQAIFINKDLYMFHPETNKFAHARTSNLNEELGMIDTILSDKTGTLTSNSMEFLMCSIAGNSYGASVIEVENDSTKKIGHHGDEEDEPPIHTRLLDNVIQEKPHVKGFNFSDDRLMNGKWMNSDNSEDIQLFFRILAVCHTAIPEIDESTGHITYEVESPDEGAFVVAAREFGFEFYKRTQSSVLVKEPNSNHREKVSREYKILDLLEFSSARKRMSIIVQDHEGGIFLFSKGADSIIYERLANGGQKYSQATKNHLEYYANSGLRTLVLAYRKLSVEEYKSWNDEFMKAKTYMGADRESKLEAVAEMIENDLVLVGATAVEDKLQEGVPQCIDKLAQAGIKIWILTGDKTETAINIGYACCLLRKGMTQIKISLDDDPEVTTAEANGDKQQLEMVSKECIARKIDTGKRTLEMENNGQAHALIIDGKALNYALEKDMRANLLALALQCASVICCRVSPKQKALVTRLVKEGTGKATLGIGDGANDVGMIQEADIGIGISGVEGMQATMASDFSISQFRFLERLLLVHGSWCYKRVAIMICYFFYKNICFGLTIFFYEAFTVFSGQPAYNDWYMSLYNAIFTCVPVIILGVFEQDLSAEVKLQYPTLYQEGSQNRYFGWKRIIGWICNAFCASTIIFFFVSSVLQKQAFHSDGHTSGLEVMGLTMYTCVILTVSCQIAMAMKYLAWFQHFVIWGSVALWYAFLVVYGEISLKLSPSAYKVFLEACAPYPVFWIIVLLIVGTALFPYLICISFQIQFSPTDSQIVHEKIKIKRDQNSKPKGERNCFKMRHDKVSNCVEEVSN